MEMAMRSLTKISGILFVVGLMMSPVVSFAQQEIESDAGEVVLDATINVSMLKTGYSQLLDRTAKSLQSRLLQKCSPE